MTQQIILGAPVRIIGRPGVFLVGAIRDDVLYLCRDDQAGEWWPEWLVESAE